MIDNTRPLDPGAETPASDQEDYASPILPFLRDEHRPPIYATAEYRALLRRRIRLVAKKATRQYVKNSRGVTDADRATAAR
jgi:hypothetical protein